MGKITAEELEAAFTESFGEDFYWGELDGFLAGPFNRVEDSSAANGKYRYEYGPAPTFDFGTVKVVKEAGGVDQGSQAYKVLEVTHNDGTTQLFRKDGYYASHYGYDWDGDFREVKAVVKQVTFYE